VTSTRRASTRSPTRCVDDYFAPDSGLNYVLSVLPDGPPRELARLPWFKLAVADEGLLDTLEQVAPDDASSLSEGHDVGESC